MAVMAKIFGKVCSSVVEHNCERCKEKYRIVSNVEWGIMEDYEIGLVVVTTYNYGNNLTNYALYSFLKKSGYRVLVIDAPWKDSAFLPYFCQDNMELFMKNPYDDNDFADQYDSRWDITELNGCCKMFIVGSDQLWNSMFIKPSEYYTCLDWVNSNKYKLSYATSLGNRDYDLDMKKFLYLLRRFQKISVREKQSAEWLNNEYGINAIHVMDPVFLCDKEDYYDMARKGEKRMPQKPFVGAYLLDEDEWKCKIVDDIADMDTSGEKMVTSLLKLRDIRNDNSHVQKNLKVEEWLAFINKSEFFITDSFHGLCMALIFHKQFLVLFNKKSSRGIDRIVSLLNLVGLTERFILDDIKNVALEQRNAPIDYERVDQILGGAVKKSTDWFVRSIQEGMAYKETDSYDMFRDEYYKIRKRMDAKVLECRRWRMKNWLGQLKREKGIDKIVAWGAGGCFYENIGKIKALYDLNIICDTDSKKWGDDFYPGIACIGPEMLWGMKNVLVIVMANYESVARSIEKELVAHKIDAYIFYKEWSKLILDE